MNDDLAVEAVGIEKSYGSTRVLNGVDLHIPRGSVHALLGPNGAGKTTMVRILSTLIRADAGSAQVAGFDVRTQRGSVRRHISLCGQHAAVDALQTAEENLFTVARLRGLDRMAARGRAVELLERFGLRDVASRRVGTYSGGTRRRLDLALSLVARPDVLFLDEPTTGLDPRSRQVMWRVIGDLVDDGVTVLLTTQYLEEADRLADRIAVLDHGRIVAEGSPQELKRRVCDQRLVLTLADRAAFGRVVAVLDSRAVESDATDLTVAVPTDASAAHVRAVLDEVDPDRLRVTRFAVQIATLDDVFFALTGREPAPRVKEEANV